LQCTAPFLIKRQLKVCNDDLENLNFNDDANKKVFINKKPKINVFNQVNN